MKIVSLALKIIVDREIGAPGHEEDIVDTLHTIDKWYLREKINRL